MSEINVLYPQIELAFEAIESELKITTIEIEEFRSFKRRIHQMDPSVGTSGDGRGRVAESGSTRGLDPARVKSAYRDTIL